MEPTGSYVHHYGLVFGQYHEALELRADGTFDYWNAQDLGGFRCAGTWNATTCREHSAITLKSSQSDSPLAVKFDGEVMIVLTYERSRLAPAPESTDLYTEGLRRGVPRVFYNTRSIRRF